MARRSSPTQKCSAGPPCPARIPFGSRSVGHPPRRAGCYRQLAAASSGATLRVSGPRGVLPRTGRAIGISSKIRYRRRPPLRSQRVVWRVRASGGRYSLHRQRVNRTAGGTGMGLAQSRRLTRLGRGPLVALVVVLPCLRKERGGATKPSACVAHAHWPRFDSATRSAESDQLPRIQLRLLPRCSWSGMNVHVRFPSTRRLRWSLEMCQMLKPQGVGGAAATSVMSCSALAVGCHCTLRP